MKADIRHVVVLMLENRSFDHMLGFLSYGDLQPLDAGAYPNTLRLKGQPPLSVGVTKNAEYCLPVDPPHSHASVSIQVHGRARAKMDGFVAAYYRKAAGNEQLPLIHWWRAEAVVVLIAALSGAVTRGSGHSWIAAAAWSGAIALVGTAGLLFARHKFAPVVDPDAVADAPRIMRCMSPLRNILLRPDRSPRIPPVRRREAKAST